MYIYIYIYIYILYIYVVFSPYAAARHMVSTTNTHEGKHDDSVNFKVETVSECVDREHAGVDREHARRPVPCREKHARCPANCRI